MGMYHSSILREQSQRTGSLSNNKMPEYLGIFVNISPLLVSDLRSNGFDGCMTSSGPSKENI
jgi:hypothetical protein